MVPQSLVSVLLVAQLLVSESGIDWSVNTSVAKIIFSYGVGCRKKLRLTGVRGIKNKMLIFE